MVQKVKKLVTVRNQACDRIEEFIYYLSDYEEKEEELKKCIQEIIIELNQIKGMHSIITYQDKQLQKVKKILKASKYPDDLFKNLKDLCKCFGIN